MVKICYVVTIAGTIESFFIPQLQHLADNGFAVYVVCSENENLQQRLGKKIKYIPLHITRGISVLSLIKSIRNLTNLFCRERFDIVQYSTPNAAFAAAIAATRAKIRVRNYHIMGFRYLGAHGFLRWILKKIEKITCSNSTSIECVSKSNLQMGVSEKIFPQEKAVVVWNGSTGGIDINRFDASKRFEWRESIRKELGYSEEDFVFGFVGRVTRDKGVNEILEAFFSMDNKCKLFIIGSSEGIETLNQTLYQEACRNTNIKFRKRVVDIERYYAAIDVLLLPSYREGFGNVVIEAGAMGTPAVISDISGPIDAVIPNVTAKVVPVKNASQLASAMRELVDHPELLANMSEKAREYVTDNFDDRILNSKILERKQALFRSRGE